MADLSKNEDKSTSLAAAAFEESPVNTGSGSFVIDVDGRHYVGETLLVYQYSYDPDGDGNVSYTWQSSVDQENWTNIRYAPDYEVKDNDLDKYIRVKAEYYDQRNNKEIVFTDSILIEPHVNTGTATFRIKGEPETGETLEVYQYSSDPDGNDVNIPIYQWYKSENKLDWSLAGYGSTYKVKAWEKFKYFKVRAFYEDLKGFSENVQTDSIQITLPINEGSANFSIKGTPAVDGLLEAYQSSNDPDGNFNDQNSGDLPSFTWQASSDGVTVSYTHLTLPTIYSV